MEQLIFFAVLILFSIIESVARSRKQRRGGGPQPEIPPPEWEAQWEKEEPAPTPHRIPRQGRPEVPSYDDDPSFDARPGRQGERSSEAGPSFDDVASSETERKRRAASSESMIPADIWEEITGLAREAKVELPAPKPRPQPPPSPLPRQPKKSTPVPRRAPMVKPRPSARPSRGTVLPQPATEGVEAHAVHLSHAGYGTDPSERTRSAQDRMDPLARVLGRDASAVRKQLRSQGAHALRQALILHEVLGPPASSRPDRY